MSNKEIKQPTEVYRIVRRSDDKHEGVYSRGYGDEYDFGSPSSARNANCHHIYQDKKKYKINRYKVTYELIEEDVDK